MNAYIRIHDLGAEFEKRILANEKNNVKFNFLVPTDPYHAYYKLRVRSAVMHALSLSMHAKAPCGLPCTQIKEFSEPGSDTAGKDQSAPADASAAAAAAVAAPAASKTLDLPVVQVIPHALAKLEKPADEIYTVSMARTHTDSLPDGLDIEFIYVRCMSQRV
jgi:splicing factor 3A subunit 1